MTNESAQTGTPVPPPPGAQRSWFRRHKILTAIGILLLLAFLGSLSKQPGEKRSRGEVGASIEPEIVISATDLSLAFKENEVRANQTYKGKLAEIEGEVFRVDEIFGRSILTLKGAPWSPGVACAFHDKSLDARIAGLDAGTSVTVIGTISGKALSVDVKKCAFK